MKAPAILSGRLLLTALVLALVAVGGARAVRGQAAPRSDRGPAPSAAARDIERRLDLVVSGPRPRTSNAMAERAAGAPCLPPSLSSLR
jgi:hypothetical protein